MSVVEQYARVHIVTDADPRLENSGAVTVVLRYDAENDPLCVRVALPGAVPREWAVERGLLVGRLGLTDAKGGPICASVRPPLIDWSA